MDKESIFLNMDIADIQKKYKDGTLDPLRVAQDIIERVRNLDGKYHAWVHFDPEALLKQAKGIKDHIKKKGVCRPLEGIPVGIKDVMNTKDMPTQMGSPLWKDFRPGNDARVVYLVKNAGGFVAGKTVTAEFAVHALGESVNPHNETRTPGTSSSGSAVAVACGMVPVALGTQTAGSIIRPASFCGIYGCKPSFGLIPRTGTLKTTDSLDTIGYFVSRFSDLERIFDVLRVHGPDYPLSYAALHDCKRQSKPRNRKWRVALVKGHTWKHVYDYAKQSFMDWAQKLSKDRDIAFKEVILPEEMKRAHQVHSTIYDKTLAYYFKEEFKQSELVSEIMNNLIRHGNQITLAEYTKALEEQIVMARSMDNWFADHDILITLSTAGAAPFRDEQERPDTALMWSMTHLPVISAPAFISPEGLPFGIQLVARRYNDILLFKFARHLRSLGFIPTGANPRAKSKERQRKYHNEMV